LVAANISCANWKFADEGQIMNDSEKPGTRRLALAAGCVALGSAASMATYSVAGGPFGALNDVGNATLAALAGALAWRLRDRLPRRAAGLAVGCAVAGTAIAVTGSGLVISGSTGWFLAALVSTFGYVGIGAWLIVLNRSSDTDAWPRRLRALGVTAGALLLLGVVAAPGIVRGLDDSTTAPGWAWFSMTAWLGIYVVFPAWAISLARLASSDRRLSRAPSQAAGA
jgi:hypothetical protein